MHRCEVGDYIWINTDVPCLYIGEEVPQFLVLIARGILKVYWTINYKFRETDIITVNYFLLKLLMHMYSISYRKK